MNSGPTWKNSRLTRTGWKLSRTASLPCVPWSASMETSRDTSRNRASVFRGSKTWMRRPPGSKKASRKARYASGGELSRIMLAIRLAQERVEPGATYVFDEVDAGIGGETATAVGAKLRELGERNQVLTITHLPQIASEAVLHAVVSKEETGGRTITRIRRVEGEERRRELARMLSGRVDEASLAHASELLVGGR